MTTKLTNIIAYLTLLHLANGLYIRPIEEVKQPNVETKPANDNEWSLFQQQLGLTKQKVDILKSQKDQAGTKELLKRFIKENPKYVTANVDEKPSTQGNSYTTFYNAILRQLRKNNNVYKTSLNFEVAEKSMKNVKRPRRKINVRMTSDMPTERIDELLQLFNEQHGIDADADADSAAEDELAYNDITSFPIVNDNDYAFGNLYEDEDLAPPRKLSHNTEFGSFQDLFLQAKRSKWQQEFEETKLLNTKNDNFL